MAETLIGFTVGETVYRATGTMRPGVIEKIVPAAVDRGYMNHPAVAVVRWPDPYRLGGSGYKHSTVALSGLRHERQVGPCDKCGKASRTLTDTGTADFPYRECGTCLQRRERRQNTAEMYGRGRRGY